MTNPAMKTFTQTTLTIGRLELTLWRTRLPWYRGLVDFMLTWSIRPVAKTP